VKQQLRQGWNIESSDNDVRAVLNRLGGAPPPPPPQAAAQPLDAEQQVGLLFSLLHAYSGPDGDNIAPPQVDVQICHGLQGLLAMQHNRALARRAHAEARANAGGPPGTPQTIGAARAQV
jgi:hypothetical protein